MASLQAAAEAVKAAVSSTTTCTPANVVTLKELLLLETESSASGTKASSRTTKTVITSRPKSTSAVKKPALASRRDEQLSARERTALATHIFNATLKALSEAAKPAVTSAPCSHIENTAPQPVSKRTLRRSLSAPLSPIQPRTLNRVATSPIVSQSKSKSMQPSHSMGCLAVAECGRVALACLRSLKPPTREAQYDFQVENGMSAFIGKLLALDLHDQALKEMRILKRRLEYTTSAGAQEQKETSAEKLAVGVEIAQLMDFKAKIPNAALSIVTTLQTQVLKLVSSSKKPAHIEALLPLLQEKNPYCPINLLLKLANGGEKQAQKSARQMALLSQTMMSMLPSVSSQEDDVATEPRLSPSPLTVFELQVWAFKSQLKWWKLAGHQGNVDDEILGPFSRCIRAVSRRHRSSDNAVLYQTMAASYEDILQIIRSDKLEPSTSSKSPLSSIYQVLGSTAHIARQYDSACCWFESLKSSLMPGSDSAVWICSVSARILASGLKKRNLDADVEQSLQEVIDSLEGSLTGTVGELNELLESLSAARRSVVGLLMNDMNPKRASESLPSSTNSLLKRFTLRYPRFARRWVGTAPGKDATAKQFLQFDQRKQLVMQSINQTMDATLMVIKCEIQSGAIDWQQLDDTLQNCTGLLNALVDSSTPPARMEQLGGYHVKTSTLYFAKFLELRKLMKRSKELNKQLLQCLSRSIDAVKGRSFSEREKAQLPMKLELFADLCKGAGRNDDAVGTLRSICTSMAEDGVLSDVAVSLTTLPPSLAWAATEKSSSLSRTLRSIAKLDKSWNDWTFFLPETERAAVLEHLMHLSTEASVPGQPLRPHDPSPAALLRIYTLDKYPVRRFRVLLHLFYQNIGEDDTAAEITSSLEEVAERLEKKDKGEDTSLSRFIPHLRIYYSCIMALNENDISSQIPALKDNILCWKEMLGSCQSKDDLYAKIDNPEALTEFLQSLSHLADLRGETMLQISISELAISLSQSIAEYSGSFQDGLVLNHSQLATQYVNIGKFSLACEALEISKRLLEHNEGVSQRVVVDFYLSQAEYYAGIGSVDEALDCIKKSNDICQTPYSTWAQSKAEANLMTSLSALIQSTVLLHMGNVEDALLFIKTGVRTLSNDWAKLEAASMTPDSTAPETSIATLEVKSHASGPRYWGLAVPLLRCLLQISSVYAHIGMFQETIYYAESAWKIAESTRSSLYRAQVAAWTGSVYLRAGKLSQALDVLDGAKDHMPNEICSSRVQLARKLGELYFELDDEEKANEYLTIAEETLRLLGKDVSDFVTKDASVACAPTKKSSVASSKRVTRTAKANAVTAPRNSRKPKAATAKLETPNNPSQLPKDFYQSSLLAAVLLSRAIGDIQRKDWSSALSTLEQAKQLPKLFGTLSLEQIITATSLIGHSMEQMISDPVFSVMQDSTISFPAVSNSTERMSTDRQSLTASPPRRSRAVTDKKSTKEKAGPAFAEALRQAQDVLIEAYRSNLSASDSGMVHRLSTLLQNTIILLSATTAGRAKSIVSSGLATVAVDLGRNITWSREKNTLINPSTTKEILHPNDVSNFPPHVGVTPDMAAFHNDYVELLPKGWSVISLSLSDNCHDLSITKLQAGHSPFILRLPLERANSRDADSEVFNFEHGREELLDIIKLANESSHSARDFSAKGERSAWWAEREALDARLKDLLSTIETTWLGGFKGIFSQHQRRQDLLARFQKSFQQILDGRLPSRSKVRGKKTSKTQSIQLDARILDLFIGLGDPTDPDCDYDEALNDLLYFVVDILQFQGERNAYDEIDFDGMVVDTYDALRGYYSAVKSVSERSDNSHTILVLDKALHAFPWESLPCMDGLAVSRVPSLACLRQLITESNMPSTSPELPEGHYVSRRAGTYILNPSSDLKNTQAFFQPSFKTLKGWKGIVSKIPEESEFEDSLLTSEVLLYFGHGSGAQYIRGKTIRRMQKCKPATFLMGCSSAALTEAGEFECYGPVWNYLMAGCPAVVGTLWDVTDRDIDRFAGRAFEEWGLFAQGTFREEDKKTSKGKGKPGRVGKDETTDDEETPSSESSSSSSLPEAVAKARGACKFKYLNAAAVVVYGIPVYMN